jgi:hypothetical protein
MKKIITSILFAISIFSISILFAGCGLLSADDITGEYIPIKNGKEIEVPNKHYYLMILENDSNFHNQPAIKMRFSIQRYSEPLGKYYYDNLDCYFNPKTGQFFDSDSKNKLTISEKKELILNNEQLKKISANTIDPSETTYLIDYVFRDLTKIPKYKELADKQSDDLSRDLLPLADIIYY